MEPLGAEANNPPIRNLLTDTLTAYADIYVNGVKYGETIQIGKNPFPVFSSFATTPDNTVTRGVIYNYPDYTLSGTVTVDVKAGDFIEFHIYAKITGAIDGYNVPNDKRLVDTRGESIATTIIKSAYIYSDYLTDI